MIIDAHHHLWDRSRNEFDYRWQEAPKHEKICRSFMPQDLEENIRAAGVDRTVLVQTQHNLTENRWALKLADENEFIAGVVGWVDLQSDACEQQLLDFRKHPKAVGIRHITQDEPDSEFIVSDSVSPGLAVLERHGVSFDLLFYAEHLRHAPTVARRFPNLKLVINHLSKPKIRDREYSEWRRELALAADCPNIYCKLSGMVTECDWDNWSIEDLKPYADAAIELFTPSRIMFGSDWPVCELAATYEQTVTTTKALIESLSKTEQTAIFQKTAEHFYGLE